ncbi:hypothetical protein SLEP1_g32630 [Rubroshorea leprosula]|uniref:Uncharacterized protein n=1 Tax=Rubroshorea leprosula TaxID=152421 RepID=A0AAV5KE32_9ROSI|nr:hypothetical protein SLEP1_g32630 [Rubroshorea leprosula]
MASGIRATIFAACLAFFIMAAAAANAPAPSPIPVPTPGKSNGSMTFPSMAIGFLAFVVSIILTGDRV